VSERAEDSAKQRTDGRIDSITTPRKHTNVRTCLISMSVDTTIIEGAKKALGGGR